MRYDSVTSEEFRANRKPRVRATANGQVVSGIIETRISSNSCWSADSYIVTATFGDDTKSKAPHWASASRIELNIELSVDAGQSFSNLIRGPVDTVMIDPIIGTIQIEGRDYTANILSSNSQESFVNRTSSEIASIIAVRHGLNPVITKTTTLVGSVDSYNRSILTLHQSSKITTDWDMLVYLAELERFCLYVERDSLHFEAPDAIGARVLTISAKGVSELKMERALPLTSTIQVTVNSWDFNQMKSLSTLADTNPGPVASQSNQALTQSTAQFFLTRPNLISSDAVVLAQRQLDDLTSHGRAIEFEMPGELTLTARDTIQLIETGTAFDQLYQIETIDRHLSPSVGFIERIRAKNISY
jgi:hypothetical protein